MTFSDNQELDTIDILEIVNTAIILVFLMIFIRRYCSLRHMGRYQSLKNVYPKIRIIFAIAYVFGSLVFLTTYIIGKNHDIQPLIFEGGVGQCLNSLIIGIHLVVLKQQLDKKQPYTKFHMIYMIYLPTISLARLISAIITFKNQKKKALPDQLIMIFTSFLLLVSLSLTIVWVRKRSQLPNNQDYAMINKESFTNFTNPLSGRSYEFMLNSNLDKKIYPTVMVEKGKIRIILQIMASNTFLKSALHNDTSSLSKQKRPLTHQEQSGLQNQHLQIISSHLYSIEEIRNIYIQTNRFNIKNKLEFKNFKMSKFYQDLKKFLDELFQIKKVYTQQILKLFYLNEQDLTEICKNIRKTCINQFQMDPCQDIDNNAMYVSVSIFKNFWVDDHFIFYMHVKTADLYQSSTVFKRYSDFEEFDRNLLKILHENGLDTYKMPHLPKKHLYGWDHQDKIKVRQKLLEFYCRQIANDSFLMDSVPAARQCILNFIGLNAVISIVPNLKKFSKLYQNLKLVKGNITQQLKGSEYITYYQFKIFRNQTYLHTISKRFQQFVHLHEAIMRWMYNTEISYKFIILPDKIIFKSQADRQIKLLKYLHNLLEIEQIYKLYIVTRFLNLGSDRDNDLSRLGLSIIKKSSENQEKNQSMVQNSQNSSINVKYGSHISDIIDDLVVE